MQYVHAQRRFILSSFAPIAAIGFMTLAAQAQLTMAPAAHYVTGQRPSGVALGDFDGDGDLDLATATDTPDKVNIHLNNGAGAFTAGPVIMMPASSSPDDLKAGDLDGDGDIDLAIILEDLNVVQVALNAGGGFSLGATAAIGANSGGMSIADIDGDGDLDLGVANRDSNTATVLRNAGNATFTSITVAAPAGAEPRAVAFGRLDGDALLDLVVSNHDTRSLSVFSQTAGGTFTPLATLSTGAQLRPEGVAAADLDNDGDDDIVAATSSDTNGNFASVYRNLGGSFTGMTNFASGGLEASDVATADLNCDGLPDVVVSNQDSNSVGLLANTGKASLGPALVVGVGTRPGEIATGDLDGDGDSDVAIANRDSNSISVIINETCTPVTSGDVDGNGVVDVDDLIAVILNWGDCPAPPAACPADVAPVGGGDGQVNVDDLITVILNWG